MIPLTTITCRRCGQITDITGHFGRPPEYCGPTCRAAVHAARQRAKRAQLVTELTQLREQVAQLTTAHAA